MLYEYSCANTFSVRTKSGERWRGRNGGGGGGGGVVCVKPAYKQEIGGEMHFRLNEISHLEDLICLSLKENITEDPSETFIQNQNLNCFVLKNCEIDK